MQAGKNRKQLYTYKSNPERNSRNLAAGKQLRNCIRPSVVKKARLKGSRTDPRRRKEYEISPFGRDDIFAVIPRNVATRNLCLLVKLSPLGRDDIFAVIPRSVATRNLCLLVKLSPLGRDEILCGFGSCASARRTLHNRWSNCIKPSMDKWLRASMFVSNGIGITFLQTVLPE